jgi:hypothetical protein
MRILLTLILLITAFCPVTGVASTSIPNKKFAFLLHFFDQNEAAFAYHRHCLSQGTPLDETFLITLRFVADELFAETIKNSPKVSKEYLMNKILERRHAIQYNLDNTNIDQGCNTTATAEAKAHYEEFSRYSKKDITLFIDEQTKGK